MGKILGLEGFSYRRFGVGKVLGLCLIYSRCFAVFILGFLRLGVFVGSRV